MFSNYSKDGLAIVCLGWFGLTQEDLKMKFAVIINKDKLRIDTIDGVQLTYILKTANCMCEPNIQDIPAKHYASIYYDMVK